MKNAYYIWYTPAEPIIYVYPVYIIYCILCSVTSKLLTVSRCICCDIDKLWLTVLSVPTLSCLVFTIKCLKLSPFVTAYIHLKTNKTLPADKEISLAVCLSVFKLVIISRHV